MFKEFLKENNVIDKDKQRHLKRTSMFELITDSQLDIIAFCDVKKCYPKVRELFASHKKDKLTQYINNINDNNIKENSNSNNNRLFSSISLSGLTFKRPE